MPLTLQTSILYYSTPVSKFHFFHFGHFNPLWTISNNSTRQLHILAKDRTFDLKHNSSNRTGSYANHMKCEIANLLMEFSH